MFMMLVAAALCAVSQEAAGNAQGIAARVNGEIITWKDVDERLKLPAKEITSELRSAKLREMAEERLFLQWAKKCDITVTEREIDEQVEREMKRFDNEDQYVAWLRTAGMTRTENREHWRRTILVSRLYSYLVRKALVNPDAETPGLMQDYVSPDEIRRYFDTHREQYRAIEHVTAWRIGLQFLTPEEKEQKRAVAESLLRKLDEGADFYLMGAFYTDIWRKTENGRELGDRGLKREDAARYYAPETVQLLFETLDVGQTSGIVEDGRTLNIFRLMQRVRQREETFEEAQEKIRSLLENRKREENRRRLRDELARRAYIWPKNLFEAE